jgi:hypothetical protein
MSRRSARNRHRAPAAKARQGPAPAQGMLTLSTAQVQALLAAGQQSGQLANPLPRPAPWSQAPFPPGQPLVPAPVNQVRPGTGRPPPRLFELPISTNINIGTAPCVPWRILQEAADMPLFRKCIERRKGICSLDFTVGVDPKAVAREAALAGEHEKDVEAKLRDRYVEDIARISDWLTVPDRENGYDWPAWLGQLFEQRLKYDATAVYPRLTYGGDLISLWVLDGSTIKPLLNEYGGRPQPPYPAYQQILYGFPRGEFTATTTADGEVPGFAADQLTYERTVIREKTPYGMSATEIALLDGILWMRRMGWLMAEYTEGVLPSTIVETDNEIGWSVTQWEDWLRAMNDHLGGNTEQRQKFQLFPPGTHPLQIPEVAERYKPDMDMFLVKLIAGDFGLTATEVGFPEVGSLGASFHEGEEDVLNRVTRKPDAQWAGNLVTKLCKRYLGMPAVLQVEILGLESEDEAAADAVAQNQVTTARLTLNEDRLRRGEAPYDFAEADMPMLISQRGIEFVEGASVAAPAGTLLDPAHVSLAPGTGDAAAQAAPHAKPTPQGAKKPDTAKAAEGDEGLWKELVAFGAYMAKRPKPGRHFHCNAITRADAARLMPELLKSAHIVFKDGGADPKGPSPSADRPAQAARGDVADGVPVNTVLTRQHADLGASGVERADLADLGIGEFDGPVGRPGLPAPVTDTLGLGSIDTAGRRPSDGAHQRLGAAEAGTSADLAHLVDGVGLVGAQEQVIGPDAGRIVAGVADLQAVGDGAVGDLPGDTVGAGSLALGASVKARQPEDAVVPVVGVPGGHPLPAVAGLVDLDPEAGLKSESHQVSVPKDWPGWQRDEQLVNVYTGRIRRALKGSMDARAVAEAWAALRPKNVSKARGEPSDPFVLQFLQRAYEAILDALQSVLGKLWPEGWVLGQQAAHAVVDAAEVDWRGWTPGDHRAAEAVAGAELRRLLDESGIRIKSIAETRLEELADVLEQTLASDVTAIPAEGPQPPVLSVGDLTRQLEAVLDNPANANLVAWTEISRAQAEAARSVYAEHGYPMVDWITAMDARVCPACAAAMASNPHPLGAPPAVPMHPRCRCAEIPALVSA